MEGTANKTKGAKRHTKQQEVREKHKKLKKQDPCYVKGIVLCSKIICSTNEEKQNKNKKNKNVNLNSQIK